MDFREFTIRNCLENSWTSLDRVFLVSQSGDKGALQPVFPTHRTSEWSPSGFSKQFRKVNSAKFAPTTAAGKIFTVFYIFAGIGIIVGFVNAVARASVEQRGEVRRRSRCRSGTLEQEED